MTRSLQLAICLIATLCAEATFAQVSSVQSAVQTETSIPAPAMAPPVAFVYVSSSPSANSSQIQAFAAAPNGRLTAVTGSPFPADVRSMALNGNTLFGTNGASIFGFSIAANGALNPTTSVNAQQLNGGCGGPVSLFFDHTGATLYDDDFDGDSCANTGYQSFRIDGSTGDMTYLALSQSSPAFNVPLSFIGNNVYAYGSTCYHFNPSIFGFMRNSDGTMNFVNSNTPMPVAATGNFYCPYLATADPTNHVAISVQQLTGNWGQVGLPQLATYTADSAGNLTTASTFSNMPKTAVQAVTSIWMSPGGKLLAVGGTAGLQVFHFNGGKPITHYTGLLTAKEVDQFFWDNDHHLYAISRSAGKLFVFTITPTSVSQAPGSPYTIANPMNIIVLPKT
jgi:hypothetical protein